MMNLQIAVRDVSDEACEQGRIINHLWRNALMGSKNDKCSLGTLPLKDRKKVKAVENNPIWRLASHFLSNCIFLAELILYKRCTNYLTNLQPKAQPTERICLLYEPNHWDQYIAHAIFLSILVEGDISASQCSAASGGLETRLLLGDVTGAAIDASYVRSIAFALGYIHCSAGGMALSNLVPVTVNSISLLAKSPLAGLQARLGLTSDILLSEENGWVDLQQGVGHLINAIVAVLGPELSPASSSFSHYKVFLFTAIATFQLQLIC
ncbi:protein SWEETIE-like [Actinidia eriantha]|uniref:protein SWEETIE-like n=1 Tax=Actinidia eriantha TaxID=165200 RepID=UPI0025835A33|nr:protein SWEETIE-like [Actinidia eriantha]